MSAPAHAPPPLDSLLLAGDRSAWTPPRTHLAVLPASGGGWMLAALHGGEIVSAKPIDETSWVSVARAVVVVASYAHSTARAEPSKVEARRLLAQAAGHGIDDATGPALSVAAILADHDPEASP